MAHRLLFEDKDDADLKEVGALIKNIRRPQLRPRFNAVLAILDCAKRGFMVNTTGEVPACVRLPFSVKLAYALKSPTEEEKSLKKMSEENGQRRQAFQGKHGMFSPIIKVFGCTCITLCTRSGGRGGTRAISGAHNVRHSWMSHQIVRAEAAHPVFSELSTCEERAPAAGVV